MLHLGDAPNDIWEIVVNRCQFNES